MLAKAAEADAALPSRRPSYDKYWMHEFKGIAYANLKKYPEAIR